MLKLSEITNRKFIGSFDVNDWNIETDKGWSPITNIHQTIPYQEWLLVTESGFRLDCADTHIVFDEFFNEIYVKDCIPFDTKIITKSGVEVVVEVSRSEIESNMYDLTIDSEDHRFYTGEILSHNSTIIDAISFCLFGKPFRNINKNQLINSINGKNLSTTIQFDVSGNVYQVIRGIKPNIFEIWKDNILITQDAALKDYQSVLEHQILKMNFKVFSQVVVLGSSSFVPFMKLSAANRREVIEDILDIRIFSSMNVILKERIQITKQELELVSNNINIAKTTVENQQKLIKNMQTSKQEFVDNIQSRIDANIKEININLEKIEKIESNLVNMGDAIIDKKETHDKLHHAAGLHKTYAHSNSVINKTLGFMDDNDNCPSCSQNIPHEHKSSIKDLLESEYSENLNQMESLSLDISSYNDKLSEIQEMETKILTIKNEKYTFISIVNTLISQNKSLQEEIKSSTENQGNIESEKEKLKELAGIAIENINKKTNLLETRDLEDIASVLLKDTGIKTAVIKEYLPLMNQLINKYLESMEFYVKFELDESFTETIKSRHRDDFSYSSFSEGERQRIDLALLFAWRDICRLKNSANTNLLILDEVLSGNLDTTGTDTVLKLLSNLGDKCNVIVISHEVDQIIDMFSRVLTFEKRHDFSEII